MIQKKRAECKYRKDLGYDYSCGCYESQCNHPKGTWYCKHESHFHKCPLGIDDKGIH